jgi:hypothetical protein
MTEYITAKRFFYDFFAYLAFMGSSYVLFATSWYFRYFLIPVTFFAFFSGIMRAYRDAVDVSLSAAALYIVDKKIEEEEKTAEKDIS